MEDQIPKVLDEQPALVPGLPTIKLSEQARPRRRTGKKVKTAVWSSEKENEKQFIDRWKRWWEKGVDFGDAR